MPDARGLPSTKTVKVATLLDAYRRQVEIWPDIEKAFFETTWFQKTKMGIGGGGQKAMENYVRN